MLSMCCCASCRMGHRRRSDKGRHASVKWMWPAQCQHQASVRSDGCCQDCVWFSCWAVHGLVPSLAIPHLPQQVGTVCSALCRPQGCQSLPASSGTFLQAFLLARAGKDKACRRTLRSVSALLFEPPWAGGAASSLLSCQILHASGGTDLGPGSAVLAAPECRTSGFSKNCEGTCSCVMQHAPGTCPVANQCLTLDASGAHGSRAVLLSCPAACQ